jgi:hypothetical protein
MRVLIAILILIAVIVAAYLALSPPGSSDSPEPPPPEQPGRVLPDPDHPGPDSPAPVDPEPVEPEPVDPEAVDPDPVEPEPVDPDPVEPEPVEPEPVEPEPVEPEASLQERVRAAGQLTDPEAARKALLRLVPELAAGELTPELSQVLLGVLETLQDIELERRLTGAPDLYRQAAVRTYLRARPEQEVVNAVVKAEAKLADEDARVWLRETFVDHPQDEQRDLVRYMNIVRVYIQSADLERLPDLIPDLRRLEERIAAGGYEMTFREYFERELESVSAERRVVFEQYLNEPR